MTPPANQQVQGRLTKHMLFNLMICIPNTLAASAESVLRTAAAGVAEILGRDFWWENSFYPG
jgi:hypothetical protein